MCISDIPPHDMSSDFVVLAERRKVEAEIKRKLEVGSYSKCLSLTCFCAQFIKFCVLLRWTS